MTVQCADCKGFYCRSGKPEFSPDDCPMRGDFPDFRDLYSEAESLGFLVESAKIEAGGYCRWTRIREVVEFTRRMEYHTIGLPHCPDMGKLAERVRDLLRASGLEPVMPRSSSTSEPLEQARWFQEQATDLNVLCGMCVGHEVLFLRASRAPAVSFIARDTRLLHNPVAGLYTSRSYLKKELFGHWPLKKRPAYLGWDSDAIERKGCGASKEAPASRSRVAEAMDLAQELGVRHIGLSFCVGFREEAKILSRLLKTNGFQVSSICCKSGSVPKEEAGILDAEKVRPGTSEMICNPMAQAELLNRDHVEFALILGQCVGHDAVTLKRLEAPTVYLVAKDRVLAHNTAAALYHD